MKNKNNKGAWEGYLTYLFLFPSLFLNPVFVLCLLSMERDPILSCSLTGTRYTYLLDPYILFNTRGVTFPLTQHDTTDLLFLAIDLLLHTGSFHALWHPFFWVQNEAASEQ